MAFINYLDRITRISPVLNNKDKSLIDTLKVLITSKDDFFEQWLKTIFEFTASDFATLFAIPQNAKNKLPIYSFAQRGTGVKILNPLPPELSDILRFATQGDQPITCNNRDEIHFSGILLSSDIKSGIAIPLAQNEKEEYIVAIFNSKYKHWYEKEVFIYLQQVREVSLTILKTR